MVKLRLDELSLSGSFTDRLNPEFGPTGPGHGHLGAKRLPNPMVHNTELKTIPEQDRRRLKRIDGLPEKFKR